MLFTRDDPFSDDLLEKEVPVLYDGLPEEDKVHIEDSEAEAEDMILLTPEMVNSQFPEITEPQPEEKSKKDTQYVTKSFR